MNDSFPATHQPHSPVLVPCSLCDCRGLCFCLDSVLERRALRESVFPKLREHCRHTLGLDVRVSTHSVFTAQSGEGLLRSDEGSGDKELEPTQLCYKH